MLLCKRFIWLCGLFFSLSHLMLAMRLKAGFSPLHLIHPLFFLHSYHP